MNAIHLHTTLNSETLNLPELRPLLGKCVEIIIREEARDPASEKQSPWTSPLAGSVLRDDDPFGPGVEADEWEANR